MEILRNCKRTEFDSRIQYYHFINTCCDAHLFNDKTGSFSLSRDGNCLYKVYYEKVVREKQLNIDNILTSEDVLDSSYLFPRELFLDRDFLLGLKVRYYGGSFLNENNNRGSLDIKTLSIAYDEFLEDTDELSNQNIYIPSLDGLLLCNGTDLIVYDTCSFIKNPKNIERLDKIGSIRDANREVAFKAIKEGLLSYSGDKYITYLDNDRVLFDYLKEEHGRVLKKHR